MQQIDEASSQLDIPEYSQISSILSQGYQAMALLLTLFFIFNSALLAFVPQMLNSQTIRESFVIIIWSKPIQGIDLLITTAALIAIIFVVWSFYCVKSFSDKLKITLQRGMEIENLYEQPGIYTSYYNWFVQGKSRSSLYKWTIMFFVFMGLFWISVAALVVLN